MAKQIIMCMETQKQAGTDYVYIKETIDRFYRVDNKIKLTPIYMNSKGRYNSNGVVKEIATKTRDFTIGATKVVYFIDTDEYETNFAHAAELENIETYCDTRGYELVWFCHDVEEVYIGEKINRKQKVSKAGEFRRKGKINEMPENRLSSNNKSMCTSNILLILDKYLQRK